MSFHEWRQRRRMKDPVEGTFTVAGTYDPSPARTPSRLMLTGTVEAPGVLRTTAEVLQNLKHASPSQLPVLVDRTDPTNFFVRWDEVPLFDFGKAAARDAARRAAGQ